MKPGGSGRCLRHGKPRGRLHGISRCDTNNPMPAHPYPRAPNSPDLGDIRRNLAGVRSPDREENTHAAVALVLAGEAANLSVCLILRATRESDRWSGHVALPGGRVDPRDLSPRAAAIRETREEVGIRLGRSSYLGSLGAQPISRDGKPGDISLSSYVFYVGEVLKQLTPNHEVAEAFWAPLQHLLDPRNAGYTPTSRDGVPYDSPAVVYQGHHIWGLTYRVLTAFFERLQLRIARPVP
jgi:8-oxo-dGTP pyrophosphatase MutT (NUDIX family)